MTSSQNKKYGVQNPAILEYILETSCYAKEHEQLKLLREATVEKYKGSWEAIMSVPIDEAQFLSILVKILNAKKTLEVGVFTGYSLLATALALPNDAKVTAIDVDREAYEVGLPFIQKAGVEHKIDFILGDAISVLTNLVQSKQEESYDFAFVDGANDQYKLYHEQVLKLVRKGGIIAYDNSLWMGSVVMAEEDITNAKVKHDRKPVLEFNKFLANDSRIESIILSIGDGTTICRKL